MSLINLAFYILDLLILIASSVGNILVIVVMRKAQVFGQSSASTLMIAVAVADFITDACAIPFCIFVNVSFESHINHHACLWMMSLVFMMFSISINLLVALAFDRYCAVCHPLFHFAHKNSGFRKWIITGIVILGIALGSLPGLGWHSESFYSCYVMDVLSFGFMIVCCVWSLGATTIIVILYGLIYKKILNHMRQRRNLFAAQSTKSKEELKDLFMEDEMKMTKTVSWVIISFAICWMPITLNFLVVAITRERLFFYNFNATFGYVFGFVSVVATHLNSAIDPLIYSQRMKGGWKVVRRMFSTAPPSSGLSPSSSQKSTSSIL